jgi:hypothetical protein
MQTSLVRSLLVALPLGLVLVLSGCDKPIVHKKLTDEEQAHLVSVKSAVAKFSADYAYRQKQKAKTGKFTGDEFNAILALRKSCSASTIHDVIVEAMAEKKAGTEGSKDLPDVEKVCKDNVDEVQAVLNAYATCTKPENASEMCSDFNSTLNTVGFVGNGDTAALAAVMKQSAKAYVLFKADIPAVTSDPVIHCLGKPAKGYDPQLFAWAESKTCPFIYGGMAQSIVIGKATNLPHTPFYFSIDDPLLAKEAPLYGYRSSLFYHNKAVAMTMLVFILFVISIIFALLEFYGGFLTKGILAVENAWRSIKRKNVPNKKPAQPAQNAARIEPVVDLGKAIKAPEKEVIESAEPGHHENDVLNAYIADLEYTDYGAVKKTGTNYRRFLWAMVKLPVDVLEERLYALLLFMDAASQPYQAIGRIILSAKRKFLR